MKLVFLRPLGIDQDIGVPRKLVLTEAGATALAAGINAAASGTSAALSANAASANSHAGRVYSRWALHQQEAENERARQFQHSESSLARQWEEQMYNMYNSPSAMMRQYREAGLNPYLAGQDALGSGMSQSAPMSGSGASGLSPGQPPGYMPDFSPIASIGPAFTQALGVMSNVANQEAKTRQTNVQTFKDLYYGVSPQAAYKFADSIGLYDDRQNHPVSLMEQQMVGQIMKENQESAYLQVQSGFIENYEKPKADKLIASLDKQMAYLDEEINVAKSQKELNEAYGRRVGSEIVRNMAAAGVDFANARTINGLRELVVNSAAVSLGMDSMEFMAALAAFNQGEYWRGYQQSSVGKSDYVRNMMNDPKNNPVFGFIKGLGESIAPIGSTLSPYIKRPPQTTYNYSNPWNTYNYYSP